MAKEDLKLAMPAREVYKLDSANPTPLYIQLADVLHGKIQSGELKPGDKIPSEDELCALFGVSRITVRKAIAELVDEDMLVKMHGKGTYVTKSKLLDHINENLNFTLQCEMNNVKPGSEVIRMEMRPVSRRDQSELQLSANANVLYIQRVRYADDEPVIVEHNYFPEKFSGLMNYNLQNRSLYEVLQDDFGVLAGRTHRSIEICTADEEEAGYLNTQLGAPLFLLREIVYQKNNLPIHRTKQIILGEKFKITIS